MQGSLRRLRRQALAVGGAALVALIAASFAFASKVEIDGTVLNGGGTTMWDPLYDSYPCTTPPGDTYPFEPAYYAGTATKFYDFSGLFALFVGGINGNPFYDKDGKGTLNGKSLSVGPTKMGDLTISEKESALESPTLRVLVKFHNNTSKTLNKTIAVESKAGYDPVDIAATSTGDKHWSHEDRWLVTSDPSKSYATGVQVWYGKGGEVAVRSTDHANGDKTCFDSDIPLHVGAGKDAYLLFYAETFKGSVDKAVQSTKNTFDANKLKKKLTRGIPPSVRKRVINWNL
jgi:hypothetical protein